MYLNVHSERCEQYAGNKRLDAESFLVLFYCNRIILYLIHELPRACYVLGSCGCLDCVSEQGYILHTYIKYADIR